MKIPKLHDRSKVTEVDYTVGLIIDLYESSDWSSDRYLTELFEELKAESNEFSSAIAKVTYESQNYRLDSVRDSDFRNLYYFTFGKMHDPDPRVKEAAQKLFRVIGISDLALTEKSYSIESSLINSIFEQVKAAPLKETVELIPEIGTLLESLKRSQRAFEKADSELRAAKVQAAQKRSATAVKKAVLPLINGKVILYMNAMAVVDEAKYGALARTATQIISDNNMRVKRRIGK